MKRDQKQINKSNEKIAEFMGNEKKFFPTEQDPYGDDWPAHYEIPKYHEDWNWLMPVVEKIQNLYHSLFIYIDYGVSHVTVRCDNNDGSLNHEFETIENTLIETVYNAVCGFVEWYNQ